MWAEHPDHRPGNPDVAWLSGQGMFRAFVPVMHAEQKSDNLVGLPHDAATGSALPVSAQSRVRKRCTALASAYLSTVTCLTCESPTSGSDCCAALPPCLQPWHAASMPVPSSAHHPALCRCTGDSRPCLLLAHVQLHLRPGEVWSRGHRRLHALQAHRWGRKTGS